jgi:two-component system, NtrC family, C4-dicarboxylate transport sensor histidine kinase DctB
MTRSIAFLVTSVAVSTLLFWLAVHQVSGFWLDMALRPDVREALQRSMDDQKRLRTLDAQRRDDYRLRFETTRRLLHRLEVLRISREEMVRRFELLLVASFAFAAALAAMSVWMRGRRAQRFERVQYLDRVEVLQETARRHAHEIKGPLAAARLELERAADALRDSGSSADFEAALASADEELERVSRFLREHASFAAIGTPVLRSVSLAQVIEEFCVTFANAWPNVVLRFAGGDAKTCADRDLLRQVLVNLCTNGARAIDGEGSITFVLVRRGATVALDVIDTGSGIAESLRARVFDPYVTTRRTGEGMGLGLSISRKIMLDHGGDLQLVQTSATGTTFRLIFGDNECN